MSNFLFAIDEKAEAVLVSASPKGSTKIDFIERIGRKDNEVLYQAVAVLTTMAQASDTDDKIFRAMDKVCQLLYGKQKSITL